MSSTPLLLPVKRLALAKRRLAGVMRLRDRQRLVLAMLEDVLDAAQHADVDPLVLSADDRVLALARKLGAGALEEPSSVAGLNDALGWGIQRLAAEPAIAILLPDTPLVTPGEILTLITVDFTGHDARVDDSMRLADPVGVAGVADRAGRGTNALLLRPPTAVAPRFGGGSFARHRRAAASAGAPFIELHLAGMRLDLDVLADLEELRRNASQTRAGRLLAELNVPSIAP